MRVKTKYLDVVLTLRKNGREKVYRFDSLTKEQIEELKMEGINLDEYLEESTKAKKYKGIKKDKDGRGIQSNVANEINGNTEDV